METEEHKLIYDGVDVVIFDGGWWMKQEDRRKLWFDGAIQRAIPNPIWGIDRDETTHQLKLFLMPAARK